MRHFCIAFLKTICAPPPACRAPRTSRLGYSAASRPLPIASLTLSESVSTMSLMLSRESLSLKHGLDENGD